VHSAGGRAQWFGVGVSVVKSTDASSRRLAILVAITLVGVALRFLKVTEVPDGFNQDEAVAVYDAYSLLRTGRDHHGAWLPLNFRSFDDWIPPAHQYLLLPFVAVFGPTVVAARLFSATLGTSVIISTYVIVHILFRSNIALIASLFVALSSWGIGFSRVGFSVIILVSTSLIGIIFYVISMNNNQSKRITFFSGLIFSIAIASYPVGKIVVPFLLLLLFLIYILNDRGLDTSTKIKKHLYNMFILLLGFCVIGMPFLLSQILDWRTINSRFESLNALKSSRDLYSILYNYIIHFDPRLLFWAGYRDGILEFPAGFRQAPLVFAPFFYIGIIYLVKSIFRPQSQLALGWLLLFPLASSLTQPEVPHEIRAGPGHPVIEIVAAIGFGCVFKWICRSIRTWTLISKLKIVGPVSILVVTVGITANVIIGIQSLFFESQQNNNKQDFKFRRGISDAIITLDKWPMTKEIYVPMNYGTFFKILYLTHAKIEPISNLSGDLPNIYANIPPPQYESSEAWWIAEADRGASVGNWGRQMLIIHPSGVPLWSVYSTKRAIPERKITLNGKSMESAEVWYLSVMIFGVVFVTLAAAVEDALREGGHLGSGAHASDSHAASWEL